MLIPVNIHSYCYYGKRPGKRGRGAKGKTTVLGIAQCKGVVKALKTKDLKRSTVFPLVKASIKPKSKVYTDEYHTYDTLKTLGYAHHSVNHSVRSSTAPKVIQMG